MNDKKIRKLVLAALLAALVCVATMVVQIPSPMQGYVNLGSLTLTLTTQDAAEVPEPGSMALVLAGVAGLGLSLRRRSPRV